MASDTATGCITVATDDCVGFAEPAEILTRLTPDDLHPARLAGPHAWHPWGLTAAPPTDRHIRLILPPIARAEAVERILDRLEGKLARTPWPPDGPLEIRRDGARLDCRDQGSRRSLIGVAIAPHDDSRGHVEVVTRDGWPILDELAALNDRIGCLNCDEPSPTELADLASWVQDKMVGPAGSRRLHTAPLSQLLSEQARNQPWAADRLRHILIRREVEVAASKPVRILAYLVEQIDHHRKLSHTRSL